MTIRKLHLHIIILFSFSLASSCSGSKNHYPPTFENRVSLINNDTLTQFFLWPVDKELRIKISAEKSYSWFFSNKLHITRGSYSGRILDGEFIEMYPNRQLKQKGQYKKGLQSGIWTSWYTNGEIASRNEWKDGLLHGKQEFFDQQGMKIRLENFERGLKHGKSQLFQGDSIINNDIYKHGSIVADSAKSNNRDHVDQN